MYSFLLSMVAWGTVGACTHCILTNYWYHPAPAHSLTHPYQPLMWPGHVSKWTGLHHCPNMAIARFRQWCHHCPGPFPYIADESSWSCHSSMWNMGISHVQQIIVFFYFWWVNGWWGITTDNGFTMRIFLRFVFFTRGLVQYLGIFISRHHEWIKRGTIYTILIHRRGWYLGAPLLLKGSSRFQKPPCAPNPYKHQARVVGKRPLATWCEHVAWYSSECWSSHAHPLNPVLASQAVCLD